MKILIIGGSQGTGAELATIAHQAGHTATVLSGSGGAPAGTAAVKGDATEPGVVRAAHSAAAPDAVVVTVGAAQGVGHQRAAVGR